MTLTTRMDNTTPPGQSQFIAGPFPGEPVSYGGYRGLLSANLPARASQIAMTGAGPWPSRERRDPPGSSPRR